MIRFLSPSMGLAILATLLTGLLLSMAHADQTTYKCNTEATYLCYPTSGGLEGCDAITGTCQQDWTYYDFDGLNIEAYPVYLCIPGTGGCATSSKRACHTFAYVAYNGNDCGIMVCSFYSWTLCCGGGF